MSSYSLSSHHKISKQTNKKKKTAQVTVARFLPKRERQEQLGSRAQQFTNVFVKNLPTSVSEDALLALFSKVGKITSHYVKRDDAGASKGFGFVNFEQPEDAVKVYIYGGEGRRGME